MSRRQRRAEARQKRKLAKVKARREKDTKSQLEKIIVEKQAPEKALSRSRRILGKITVCFLGLIAIIGFAYQFRPEIAVERDLSLNPRDPFSTQFRITNNGLLPLYDIALVCTINNEFLHDVAILGGVGQEPVSRLGSKESATRRCSIIADGYLHLSELTLRLSFRSIVHWGKLSRNFKFVNKRDSAGQLQWIPQPAE